MAKLKKLEEIWGLGDNTEKIVQDLPLDNLVDFKGHPFTLYEGERLDDLVESIKTKGVMTPILVRKRAAREDETAKGDVLETLAGHNRRKASKLAGKTTIPGILLEGVSDEEAMAIVIETNLLQRSFADMKHSEKATVIALHHSKMFSQGKRNDIIETLELLNQGQSLSENVVPDDINDEDVQGQTRWNSARLVGEKYGLSKNSISRYLRVNKLVPELKDMLDNDVIGLLSAVSVSYLSEHEQILLADIMLDCGYSLSPRKAEVLRQVSKEEGLNTISVKAILTETSIPKTDRLPVFKFKSEVYSKYFTEDFTQEEVAVVVEDALQYYFEVGPGKNELQNQLRVG